MPVLTVEDKIAIATFMADRNLFSAEKIVGFIFDDLSPDTIRGMIDAAQDEAMDEPEELPAATAPSGTDVDDFDDRTGPT